MNEQKFPEIITLRGHHISFFFEYLLWKYAPPAWDIFASLIPQHGATFVKNKKELFEYLYNHPSQVILIVENVPDNLCDGGCLQRSQNCFKQTSHDQVAVECYGLKMWQTYRSVQFINEICSKQQIGKPLS